MASNHASIDEAMLNNLISKIPKPLLVFVVLCGALAFFIYNDPLKDECDIQAQVFERNTKGILTAVRKNKKIQFAQINFMRDRCKEGNTIGACVEYFDSLAKIVGEFKVMNQKCQIKYAESNEFFLNSISQGLRVMSLVAWGEKPPAGLADRMGWLNETHIKTFCGLKKAFSIFAEEEAFKGLRDSIFLEYPDAWPETMNAQSSKDDLRNPENRPRALKTALNPNGTLTQGQIYERSLFSIRCDLFL